MKYNKKRKRNSIKIHQLKTMKLRKEDKFQVNKKRKKKKKNNLPKIQNLITLKINLLLIKICKSKINIFLI